MIGRETEGNCVIEVENLYHYLFPRSYTHIQTLVHTQPYHNILYITIPLLQQDHRAPCFRFDGAIGLYIYYIRHIIIVYAQIHANTHSRLKFRRSVCIARIDRRSIVFRFVEIIIFYLLRIYII